MSRVLNAGLSESEQLCRWCWEPCSASRPGVRWPYPTGPSELEKRGRGEAAQTALLIVHVEHLDALEKTGGADLRSEVADDILQGRRQPITGAR